MKTIQAAKRLAVYRIYNADFYVDIEKEVFREVERPWNEISFKEIGDNKTEAVEIPYDCHTKNVYAEIIDPDHIPTHVRLVTIPSIPDLQALAAKQQNERQGQNQRKTHRIRRC